MKEKVQKFTLTTLTAHLSRSVDEGGLGLKKKNQLPIEITDVQGYVRRGQLPTYMGNYTITTTKEACIVDNRPLYVLKERK